MIRVRTLDSLLIVRVNGEVKPLDHRIRGGIGFTQRYIQTVTRVADFLFLTVTSVGETFETKRHPNLRPY